MADTKISGLTALTGANAVSGDLLTIVDVSDTTMAATGTNKKITLTELQSAPVSAGTANGVLYLNGSKVATSGSALTFDGTNLGVGTTSPGSLWSGAYKLVLGGGSGAAGATIYTGTGDAGTLAFADGLTGNDPYRGFVQYLHGSDALLFGSSGSEGMRLTTTGLGIGTSSPAVKLQVYNNINGTPFAWGNATRTGYLYQDQNGVGITNASGTSFDEGVYLDTANSKVILYTNSTDRVTLDSSGNLLMGKASLTDTGAGFAFGGGSNAGLSYFARSSGIVMSLHRYTTTGDIVRFVYDGSPVGTISVTGSATAYNTSSDYRLKNIDGPLTGSGAFIDALKPKVGTWKADGSRFVGFIAHEVQEVSPGSVTGEKDGEEMQAMEYGSAEFIANIVAELQSLRARVAALES